MCSLYGKNNFNNNKNCMDCKNVMGDFLAYLNSYLDINPKIYDVISRMLQVRELGKNEVIVNKGETCREAFWLQSGYGRHFKIIRKKSGLTKYLQIVFITLHFV
jgi:hypothetical protein